MRKKPKYNQLEAGFSILEMALIVVFGGILLSFLGASLATFMHKGNVETTEYRLAKIQEALSLYLSINGRYPCASDRELNPKADFFGREDLANCDAAGALMSGTFRQSGVRIGAVPTRTLNLPDDFIADAWGRKFTYAVTEVLATNQKYRSDAGQIEVLDFAGATIVNDAHYIVVSHGKTGDGAFSLNGGSIREIPCPTAPNTTLDAENCDDDSTFRASLVSSDSTLSNFYDDYIAYVNRGSPLGIPTGAVIPFYDVTDCPVGWTNYIPAEGRMVIGVDTDIITRDQYLLRFAVPATKSISTNVNGFDEGMDPPAQQAGSVIPPYLALTYCEKLPLLEK